MKRKIQANLHILSFLILLVILLLNNFSYIKNDIHNQELELKGQQYCASLNKEELEKQQVYCDLVEQNKGIKTDFYTVVTWTFSFGLNNVCFIIFLFITIPTIRQICRYLKNNILKNELTRQSYRHTFFKLLKEAYKPIYILPLLAIVEFIISYCYTRNFNFESGLLQGTIAWKRETVSSPFIFMIVYLVRLLSFSILYINISLCIARKQHNFLIATFASYITFFATEIFLEVFINLLLFENVFKTNFGYIFNIISVFSIQDGYGLLPPLLFSVFLAVISIVIVFFFYRDKEKLVKDCEKND